MKRGFTKVIRVLWMPILLAAFCLLPGTSFATSQSVTPGLDACTSAGDFTTGTGLLVLQEIGEAPIACTIGTVVSGNVLIYDPPNIDGGELSDVLSFVANGDGETSTAFLYSAGEWALTGFTSSQPGITEDNSGIFPYTLYDPATGWGGPDFNNGAGYLTLTFDHGVLTVDGISDNAYVVVSNTDERVPEPATATLSLAGLGLLVLVRRLRRK